MVAAVFSALSADEPPRHFTVGINDDVSRRALVFEDFSPADEGAALALERSLTQGDTIRISFHRSRFARRAERFGQYGG